MVLWAVDPLSDSDHSKFYDWFKSEIDNKKNWIGPKIGKKDRFFDWSIINFLFMISRWFFKYDRSSNFYLQSIIDFLSITDKFI